MKKIIALMMAVLMVASVFAACGNSNNAKKDATEATQAVADIDAVKAKGKLVVGITNFEPMDYKDENNEWIGFDADMAKAFAESLGVKAEFVEIDWDNKALELSGGTIDCVWNGMTLTEEVTAAMSCSDPYCNNAQVIVVNKADAEKYAKADDCKEIKFAVESGSAGQQQAKAYGLAYTEVKDQATALMEVASGTSDAAIIDSLMADAMVGEGTGYEQLTYTASLNSEEYGVGFRIGSDLTAKCNEFFAAAKADGTMQKIAETYKVQAALIK